VRRFYLIKILMSNYIETNNNDDGIDRRGFLKCMAWAGTGVVIQWPEDSPFHEC
jgi:hypothetical protein